MKLNPTLRDDPDVAKLIAEIKARMDITGDPLRDTLLAALANVCFAIGCAKGTKTACDTFERLVKGT